MISRNYRKSSPAQTPHGIQAAKMYDSDNAIIMHLLLHPGESLKPHITPVDVAFYVLEGIPTIMVGEETLEFKKDDLIESPKDIPHCIYNKSNENVRVLVIKVPKPTTQTKML